MLHLPFAVIGGGKTALNFRRRVTVEAITTLNSIPCSAGCPFVNRIKIKRKIKSRNMAAIRREILNRNLGLDLITGL